MIPDEEDLVKRAKSGNIDAFGKLIKRYKDAVYGIAYSKVGSFYDAQDITQDAFMSAYQKLDTLKSPGRFGNWVCTIARNLSLNWLHRRRKMIPLDEISEKELPVAPADPLRQYERMELIDKVQRAVSELSEPNRIVTALYYINGYTQEEISQYLAIPTGTVGRRLHDSRKQLKKDMMHMVKEMFESHKLKDSFAEDTMKQIIEEGHRQSEMMEFDEAIAHYNEALEAKPGSFDALKGLGMAHLQLGWRLGNDKATIEKAIPFLSKALEVKPEDLKLRTWLAQAHGGIGQKDKQIELHRENVKRAPEKAWTHLQLAWAYGRGDIQRQKEELEKCLSFAPEEVTTESRARLSLAVISIREGRYEDAEKLLVPALDLTLEPFFRTEIHAHIAETLAYQGKIDSCIQHVRRAIVMDEENRFRNFFKKRQAFDGLRDNAEFMALTEPR